MSKDKLGIGLVRDKWEWLTIKTIVGSSVLPHAKEDDDIRLCNNEAHSTNTFVRVMINFDLLA